MWRLVSIVTFFSLWHIWCCVWDFIINVYIIKTKKKSLFTLSVLFSHNNYIIFLCPSIFLRILYNIFRVILSRNAEYESAIIRLDIIASFLLRMFITFFIVKKIHWNACILDIFAFSVKTDWNLLEKAAKFY